MALFKMWPENHILNFLEHEKREWARSFSLELDLRKGDDQLRSENTPLICLSDFTQHGKQYLTISAKQLHVNKTKQ